MTFTPALALVTGASSGLGALIARRVAERGSDLVLVARRRDRLAELAAELRRRHGVQAHPVVMDLGRPGAGPALLAAMPEEVAHRPLDLVVNNAGFGLYGPLLGQDAERLEEMLTLNVTALTSITRTLLEPMVRRGHGTLVNVASTGGFQPAPGLAAYVASKAYVLHLTEALWQELRRTRVRVTALCPGPTSTEFFDVAGSEHGALGGKVTTPEQVVDALMTALDRRRLPPYLVPDLPNQVQAVAARVLPRRLTLGVAARVLKQG
ncbi:SDR family NAD(P)-dependent oxidoreductase [Auraticoccus sp. F435]|uniref:SDR family NAD(P)-dependent oxidoreductase n=1 Tax=Auraticoccus cholistanensis TaxID=2656650 RepID=A0A6A9UXX7_9ACTN|nr:SDR family oxidoreductase [Auraticoccus cholistanensis]MVA76247.1 SDR family NAD(P)-dependent oxidoreductase [Auraticoccus cholistanensis]